MNAWGEDPATLKKFAREEGLKHRILLDGEEVAERYGPGRSVPTVFWIDPGGVIVDTESGFGGPRTLQAKTERLLRGR